MTIRCYRCRSEVSRDARCACKDGIVLIHADCREVLPMLPQVDLVVTDPPFGLSMPGVEHEGQPGKGSRSLDFFPNDSAEESGALARDAIALTEALMQPHASGYAWLGHRQFAEMTEVQQSRGWTTRFLVWKKTCPPPPPPGSGWPSAAELCLYWFKAGRRWTHDGTDFPRSNVIEADAYRFGKPGKTAHPTQKPFACIKPLIIASSIEGDLVLDCFAGSGTTLRAALELGRRCIGIEVNAEYCEIAARRLDQKVLEFKDAI